jgi:hypothetical protein
MRIMTRWCDVSACSGEVDTGSLGALRASQRADENMRQIKGSRSGSARVRPAGVAVPRAQCGEKRAPRGNI